MKTILFSILVFSSIASAKKNLDILTGAFWSEEYETSWNICARFGGWVSQSNNILFGTELQFAPTNTEFLHEDSQRDLTIYRYHYIIPSIWVGKRWILDDKQTLQLSANLGYQNFWLDGSSKDLEGNTVLQGSLTWSYGSFLIEYRNGLADKYQVQQLQVGLRLF